MKRPIKMILFILVSLLLLLIATIIIRTYTYPFTEWPSNGAKYIASDTSSASIARFSGGLKIPTVSATDNSPASLEPFDRFKNYLEQAYPSIYRSMETYTVNTYGLVFKWKGRDPDQQPILFISHYDVVPPGDYFEMEEQGQNTLRDSTGSVYRPEDEPVPPINEVAEKWEYPPFSGAVVNGRIYGRGSLDMKGMLFAILEAADQLISEGFTPSRDIYLAFGHDEEIGGSEGAIKIAEDFRSKNLRFESIYDEGGLVLSPDSGGIVDRDVALVGIAEKGFLTVRISVKGLGGHASMPPRRSALGQAAIIMQRLVDHKMPSRLIVPVKEMLINIGQAMGFENRMGIANQWLFKPILLRSLSVSPSTNALIRTTTALTMAKGSDAFNVLPPKAEIVANFLILPHLK